MASTDAPLLHLAHFNLRFRRDVRFHFVHGMAAYAALLDRLGNPPEFPRGTYLFAPESGRVQYARGDGYRLGLAVAPGARPSLGDWVRLLARPAATRFGRTDGAPLGDSFELESVHDALRDSPVSRPAALRWSTLVEAASPAARLEHITLRLLSPLTILRTPVEKKCFVFDGEHADVAVVFQRAAARVAELFPGVPLPLTLPRGLRGGPNHLVRADLRYPKKTIPGSLGRLVALADEPMGDWVATLMLAGIVGIGQSTNMGQGRLAVDEAAPLGAWPPARAETLLSLAARAPALDAAAEAMRDAGPAPGIDGVDLATFLDRMDWERGRAAAAMVDGRVAADALLGLLVRRPDGRYRPLALPTMRDRFAQRAICASIRDTVDTLLDEASFAYRPNLSRRSAQAELRRAQDDGLTWIFEGDIARFFDEVPWAPLRERIDAWFGPDPLGAQLMAYVQAPVMFDGKECSRERGLAQGAVVSPLLANLYLDCFDDALAARGMRLIRYADDFVIACRSESEAREAEGVVQAALGRLDLELAAEKSAVRSFDQGFKFLGSVFCRSLVFDAPRRRDRDGPEVVRSFAELAGDDKALASLGEEGSWMRLLASGPDPGEEERRWRSPVASQGPDKRVAYIVSGDARVSGRKHGLWIERKGLPPQCIAWANLAQVVVLGGHFIAPSLYNHAMQHRVPVALHRRDGSPLGLVLPDGVRSPSPRAIRQWAWGRDARNGLPVARALVEAKISNTRLLLRRQGESRDDILEMLAGLAKLATCAESIDRLRGVEGQAAHAWFSAWPELVGADFPWPGRTGRGARDPVNAMLNLLYTMLYRRTWLATLSAGLDAYAGILHAANGRHAALASDLMEPFRFLADRAVLEALHRRRVRPEDFVYDEKSRVPVRLREPTLKLLVELWEAALAREVEWQGTKASYQRHLDRQARSLAEVVDGERAGIEAFRMKW